MKISSLIHSIKASSEKGGALIYILIAIALLAALTSTFVGESGQSSRTQNAFQLAQQLNSQSRVIRSAIQDCVLRYAEGNNAIAEANYNDPYPLNPNSNDSEYSSYDTGDPGTSYVEDLRCPGASFAQIFGGAGEFSGYLPTLPDLMEPWEYFNGDATVEGLRMDGVYFQTTSTKSDPFIAESMTKVDELMAACEVDYIVGDGTNSCPSDTQCLRYWIIRSAGTAATGGPNSCP